MRPNPAVEINMGQIDMRRHPRRLLPTAASVAAGLALTGLALGGCGTDAPLTDVQTEERPLYVIGPGDDLTVFVWGSPELSTSTPVRPDGRVTLPLIEDLNAAGKHPSDLADDIEEQLAEFVQNPIVSVIVTDFVGPFDQQVRVVGEAAEPAALQFRDRMTVLDAMIEVGGLTEFAAGNRAVLVRHEDGLAQKYRVRLDDLLDEGDVTANAPLLPGDILIIPESWF